MRSMSWPVEDDVAPEVQAFAEEAVDAAIRDADKDRILPPLTHAQLSIAQVMISKVCYTLILITLAYNTYLDLKNEHQDHQ